MDKVIKAHKSIVEVRIAIKMSILEAMKIITTPPCVAFKREESD